MPSTGGSTPVIGVKAELIADPLIQNALIDYIVTTPNNFNANLFRGFLENPVAQGKLIDNYMEKIHRIVQVFDPNENH